MNILIIGAGKIAIAYADILNYLGINYKIFQRLSSSKIIPKELKVIKKDTIFDLNINDFTHIINCVDLDHQAEINLYILEKSNSHLLSEKPGFIYRKDYLKAIEICHLRKKDFFIAYNRRFFESVIKLNQLCKLDGGISSMHFDFTEWKKSVDETNISSKAKERWALLNSAHLIDLAFYICGKPKSMKSEYFGSLSWHPTASIMKGYGITEREIPFSFSSDWGSAGRWDIQIFTPKRKFILSPLEKLQFILKDSIQINEIELTSGNEFKDGFLKQIEAFLFKRSLNIPNLEESYDLYKIITQIFNYE